MHTTSSIEYMCYNFRRCWSGDRKGIQTERKSRISNAQRFFGRITANPAWPSVNSEKQASLMTATSSTEYLCWYRQPNCWCQVNTFCELHQFLHYGNHDVLFITETFRVTWASFIKSCDYEDHPHTHHGSGDLSKVWYIGGKALSDHLLYTGYTTLFKPKLRTFSVQSGFYWTLTWQC